MSYEALRALEKEMRDIAPTCENDWAMQLTDWADDIASILTTRQEVAQVADGELPGMWSTSDFTGGDPDERSYSERTSPNAVVRDAVHDAISRALDEAGIKQPVLRGMCLEVGLEKFADAICAISANLDATIDVAMRQEAGDGT